MESKSTLVQALKAVFWPQRCIFCDELIFDNRKNSCDNCLENLPYVKGKICYKCGREKNECTCSSHSMFFDRAIAPFYFEDGVRECIHLLKFNSRKEFAEPLSEYMLECFNQYYSDEKFDLIVNVPMYKKDKLKRGFDQSEELAFYLSLKTGIPFKRNLIQKIEKTQKQSSTNEFERFGNIFGVYHIQRNINLDSLRVLLIDDVHTTGATLSECGKMLYLSGAERVCCLSVALTKKKKKGQKQ